jgi:hypothetical protein
MRGFVKVATKISEVVNETEHTTMLGFRNPISGTKRRISIQAHALSNLFRDKKLLVSTLCWKSNSGCPTHRQPLQWLRYLACCSMQNKTLRACYNYASGIEQQWQELDNKPTTRLPSMVRSRHTLNGYVNAVDLLTAAYMTTHLGTKNWKWETNIFTNQKTQSTNNKNVKVKFILEQAM